MPTLIARTEGSRRNLGASRAFLAVSAGRLAGVHDFLVSLEMGDSGNHSCLGSGFALSRWNWISHYDWNEGNLQAILQYEDDQGRIGRTRRRGVPVPLGARSITWHCTWPITWSITWHFTWHRLALNTQSSRLVQPDSQLCYSAASA